MDFNPQQFLGGLGGIFGGLFGDSGAPYDKAMEQNTKYGNMAAGGLQPYLNAGNGAIPAYQEWLEGQKDPSKFINGLQSQYNESPYTKFLQQQAMRAGQNAGSASGLTGSTPMMQQMQQNAANIGAGGMNDWLQNVLGINTQYGQGQNNLMTGGQNAANSLSKLYSHMGDQMGEQAYNKEASGNNDFWNTLGGIGGMIGSFF